MAEKKKLGAYENPRYIDPTGSIKAVTKMIEETGDDAAYFSRQSGEAWSKEKAQKEEQETQDKSDTAEKELAYKDLDRKIDAKTQTEKPKFGDNIFQSTRPKFTLNGDGDKSGNASMNRLATNTKNFYDPDHSLFDK